MDCARFERRLAELMEGGGPGRDEALEELREHTRSCPECSGSGELVELLALPPGERDSVPDPGPAYWSGFEGRVRARIAGEAAPAPVWRSRWLPLAAMLAVGVIGGWWLLRVMAPGEPAADGLPFPEQLEQELVRAESADVRAHVDALAGPWESLADLEEEDPDGYSLFPDVSDLDADSRNELLRWLKDETSRES